MATIWLPDGATWPVGVTDYLDANKTTFVGWHTRKGTNIPYSDEKYRAEQLAARQFDEAIRGLSKQLLPHSLRGYHNARLTTGEIAIIKRYGMSLPCLDLLAHRIGSLVTSNVLSAEDAARLLEKNQADEEFRKNRIWFCFYEPSFAGQGGIEDLLRHWGGEALYNSHDRDDRMGPILRGIGTPCVVQASVPIVSLSSVDALSLTMVRIYAKQHGASTETDNFEACAVSPLLPESVVRIVVMNDPDFGALTGCNEWDHPLV